jgi:pimeloyl-ACP methyl ester carboxylesterase
MYPALLIIGGLLACALVAVGVWAWAPERPRALLESRYRRPSTEYREVAGVTLRIRDTGMRTAPPIVLLHGFGSSLETWDSWADALDSEHRVIRFDLPGSGLSGLDPQHDYDDARSLAILHALFGELRIDRAVVVGNSLGGRLAWKFAAAFPQRVSKLILISPDGFASPGFEYGRQPKVPAMLKLMQYFLPKALLRTSLAAAYSEPARLSDAVLDRYYDLLLATGNRSAMIARMQQTVLEDPVAKLRRIAAPTLLLWGEKDAMIPYANAADYLRHLPTATLVSLPDQGHVPHEESPLATLAPVSRFLAGDGLAAND